MFWASALREELIFLGLINGYILKDFIDQKRDEKDVQRVWSDISVYNTINRAEMVTFQMVMVTNDGYKWLHLADASKLWRESDQELFYF